MMSPDEAAGAKAPKLPRTPAQIAALDKGRPLGREAAARNRELRKADEAESEQNVLESLLATLPPPPEEASSQELTFARLTAREQVYSDRLSAALEFNRQHSRQSGRQLIEVLKSVRHLTDLHTALQQASATRVNALKGLRDGKPIRPPNTPERALTVSMILVQAGAASASSEAQKHARALAAALEREAEEKAAIDAEFQSLPTARRDG